MQKLKAKGGFQLDFFGENKNYRRQSVVFVLFQCLLRCFTASLVAYALQSLTGMILGWLPGFLGDFPFLQVGLPAILSLYFDIFSGLMQAFIFAMLTMLYVSGGFPEEDYIARRERKRQLKAAKNQ